MEFDEVDIELLFALLLDQTSTRHERVVELLKILKTVGKESCQNA